MSTKYFHCRKCNSEHSLQDEDVLKYMGRTARCRKCQCEDAFMVAPEEMPVITEFTVARVSFFEKWGELLKAGLEALVRIWEFLQQDTKRGWIVLTATVVFAAVGYREIKEFQTDWRFNRRLAYQQKVQEQIEAKRLEVSQKQLELLEKREAVARQAERRLAAEKESVAPELPKIEITDTEPEPVEQVVFVTPDDPPTQVDDPQTIYQIESGPEELVFTNGATVLVEPKQDTSQATYRGMASTSTSTAGVNLVIQQADGPGLISFFSTAGIHLKSIGAKLYGSHPLELSPDGRYLTSLSYRQLGKREVAVIDVDLNQQVIKAAGTPICFSQDSRHLAIYMDSGELRIWKTGSGMIDIKPVLKVGRVLAGAFIRPELLLIGTKEGLLAMVDVRTHKILDQFEMGLPVEKICAVSGEDKAVLVLGFQNNDLVPAGQVTVAWVDCFINGREGYQESAASRFVCRLEESGRKPGDHPLLTKDGHHMAFVENVPTGTSPKGTRKVVSLYSTRQPNKLLRILAFPMQLQSLECFCNSGKRLYGVAHDGRYIVLDLEMQEASIVGEPAYTGRLEGKRPRHLNEIQSIDDFHFATSSKSGKVTLYRISDCLAYARALNEKSGIPIAMLRKIGRRSWTIGDNQNSRQFQATAVSYQNGQLTLRTVGKKKVSVLLSNLSKSNQEYLGWLVGGPTEDRKWQLIRGNAAAMTATGTYGRIESLIAGKNHFYTSSTGRITSVEGPVIYFEEKGKQVRRAKTGFSNVQINEIEKMSSDRFRRLLPAVEQLTEVKVFQGPTPLEGAWEIIADRRDRDSVMKTYLDRRSRTIVFQGNRMHCPIYQVGAKEVAKITWWQNYRFAYYPQSKMLVRCIDGLGGVFVETPMSVKIRGDRLEITHLIPSGPGAIWTLKRIKDDQMKIRSFASQQGGKR